MRYLRVAHRLPEEAGIGRLKYKKPDPCGLGQAFLRKEDTEGHDIIILPHLSRGDRNVSPKGVMPLESHPRALLVLGHLKWNASLLYSAVILTPEGVTMLPLILPAQVV